MATIDLSSLLAPVSADAPCGTNLEYDPAFGELERSAQTTPEREMGGSIIPAVPPDWSDVRQKALGLFDRTKDLRVAVLLVHASLHTHGLPALAEGLTLIRGLLTDYWDSVHPELDREDHDDPTLRMNSLLMLNDRAEVVASLSRCPLIRSRALGVVTLRGVRVAAGEIPAGEEDGSEPMSQAQIDAAFLDGALEDLEANAEAARTAQEELKALIAFLNENAGSAAPDLGALSAEVRAVSTVLSAQLARRKGDGAPADEEGAGAGAAGAGAAGASAVAVGEIKSRDDVIRALDRICQYFEKNEPSSPVPLLLRRAKRLVAKDFMEILRDLTPDGVSQAELIGGLENQE
jgi:type VI secretion system protein ImpA